MTTDQLLELATRRHRTGDLVEARRLYREILANVPTHAMALFRGGLSQLFQLGLCELAAATDEAFIGAAVALSRDIPRLAELRQQLRPRLAQSSLMDAPRFARQMEALYRGIWSAYCGTNSISAGAIMH